MNCTLAISLKFTESGGRSSTRQPSSTWTKPPSGVGPERRQPHPRETCQARPGRGRSAMSEVSGAATCATRTGAHDFPLRIPGPRVRTFLLPPRANASRRERVRTRRSSIDTNGFSRDTLICEPACRHWGQADPYRPCPVRLIAVRIHASPPWRQITKGAGELHAHFLAETLAASQNLSPARCASQNRRPHGSGGPPAIGCPLTEERFPG